MRTNIKMTGTTLTPAISAYVDKRFTKIAKILGTDTALMCDIELAKTTNHHTKGDIFKAEAHIVGAHKNLYASSEQSDLYTAIDDVQSEILAELKSDKEKKLSFVRRGGARMKAMVKGMWPWGKR
jgi:ribosomal subunit interface protein